MIYADAGFFVALKVRLDTWHKESVRFLVANQDVPWLWSPWHRVEVFNSIRQNTRHPDKSRRLRAPEAKAVIQRLENDVRVGYFTHMEADWRDVLRTANEISAANACSLPCRSADLLHVAYAVELAARTFISFDDNQLAIADAAGLEAVKPD